MSAPAISVGYDPRLVEEAVFLAVKDGPRAEEFHRERAPLYEIGDVERREEAFRSLHLRWFRQLALAEPLEKGLQENELLRAAARLCWVGYALRRDDEGAELFVKGAAEGGRRQGTIRFLVCPHSFLDREGFELFVRRELVHLEDMLDPNFGYRRELPVSGGDPARVKLFKERYRVLWDATVDGRLVRRGLAPASLRDRRLAEFTRAFPTLGEKAPEAFSRFFDREPHMHAELVAFALEPGAAGASRRLPGERCPLCRFVSHAFESEPERLPGAALEEIQRDFPGWRPQEGLCLQCADLYRARSLSRRAAESLPGARRTIGIEGGAS